MLTMTQHTNQSLTHADQEHYLQVFKRYPLALERGEGSRVWDVEGNEYIDVLAGIAVNSVGHAHPKVVQAIQAQAEKLIHISNFYVSEPQVALAKKLKALSGLDRVFFTSSGAESVEGAIKLARKYGHTHGKTGTIISMHGSFHGRTMATIATGKAKMQQGFGPIPKGFHRVPFNDFKALQRAVWAENPAAVILEPIQGEGGINPADKEYLKKVRELCDKENTLLILDEIQCGMGRTGKMFDFENFGVKPDILTLAKALGGGVPIGAVLAQQHVDDAMDFGDHGTTYGGNPLVCAASLANIEAMEEEDMLAQAREKGELVKQWIHERNHPLIKEIRGMGLMIGIDLTIDSPPIAKRMLDHGILANATAGTVIRMVPPLNIPTTDLHQAVDVLFTCLDEHHKNHHA